MFTRVFCSVNDHVESNTELCDENCIQGACDPFVLHYRVSPVIVRVSERVYIDGGRQTFASGQFERRDQQNRMVSTRVPSHTTFFVCLLLDSGL